MERDGSVRGLTDKERSAFDRILSKSLMPDGDPRIDPAGDDDETAPPPQYNDFATEADEEEDDDSD